MTNGTLRIYIVVDVMAGVVAGAKSFVSLKDAQVALRDIRRTRNLDDDDVQLLVNEITVSSSMTRERGKPRRKA